MEYQYPVIMYTSFEAEIERNKYIFDFLTFCLQFLIWHTNEKAWELHLYLCCRRPEDATKLQNLEIKHALHASNTYILINYSYQ